MPALNDHELLAEFARSESEAAFATLVTRYVNLVYSTALRFTGNPHDAEEITQAVFIILARKAGKLSPRTVLSGWLYQTARLTAANWVKGEIRRHRREQEAYMQSVLNETDTEWQQIAPLLDEAMGVLGETDRNAVVLRFFENKTAREVAAALKLTEPAAHKRVSRALEKLRKFFVKRGVSSTTAIIAGTISTNSVHAAPAALAKSVTTLAVAKGAAVGGSTLTLIKGALKIMAWTKAKTGILAGVAIVLAGGITTLYVRPILNHRFANEIALESQNAYAALSSYSDDGKVVTEGAGPTMTTTFNIRLQRPNLYRIDWTQTGGLYVSKGSVWSDGSGNYYRMGAAGQEQDSNPEKMTSMQMALAAAGGVSGSAATTIPAAFFRQGWDNVLGVAASGRYPVKKEGEQRVGNVECYVISYALNSAQLPKLERPGTGIGTPKLGPMTSTLWIGKEDHLIHQIRTTMASVSLPPLRETEDDIRKILEKQNKPATPEAIAAMRSELAAQMKKLSGKKIVFTQTHENISLNKTFARSDFNL